MEKSNLKQDLNKYEVELMLALIESAINKNNFYVAKKYMNEYRFEVNIFKWLRKCLCYILHNNNNNKMNMYII